MLESRTKHFAAAASLATLILVSSPGQAVDGTKLTTPRGAAIEVLEEKPAGPGPFPVLVLAPGSGYHMRLPILERVAQALLREGIAVIRFNWAYYVKDGEHGVQSKDRAAEVEDMTTVLNLARHEPWTDKQRIIVGGKSLVYHRVAGSPRVAGRQGRSLADARLHPAQRAAGCGGSELASSVG